jgi:hypothetical protein
VLTSGFLLTAILNAWPARAEAPRGDGDVEPLRWVALGTEDPLTLVPRVTLGLDWVPTYHGLDDADSLASSVVLDLPFKLGRNVYNLPQLQLPFVIDSVAGGAGFSNLILTNQIVFEEEWGKWGVGLDVGFPTSTGDDLGSDSWLVGPAVGFLLITEWWECGAVARSFFSLGPQGDEANVAEVNLSPELTYATARGWIWANSPMLIRYDLDEERLVTAPVGGKVGKALTIADFPVELAAYGEYNLVDDRVGPGWVSGLLFVMLLDRLRR